MYDDSQIMVTVVVCTYMRENMIRTALDSILSQQTTYPYEIIVGENHGTDNTLAILREYEKMHDNIKVIAHEKNIGALANWLTCVRQARGKYIMDCCDDDWWHNPNKIQSQIDYMEAHPKCVLCHTDYDVYNEKTGKTLHSHNQSKGVKIKEGYIQEELLEGAVPIVFPTQCYRRAIFEKYVPVDKFIEYRIVGGDYAMWVILAAYGEVCYLPISTGTYRVGNESITRSVNYDKIIARREGDKNTLRMLYSMFPNLGTYHEDQFFDDFYSHQLVMAAYRANDYLSARKFAKEDKMPNWKTRMAYTWITFQIATLATKVKTLVS